MKTKDNLKNNKHSSLIVIIAAIVSNFLVFLSKVMASIVTGSSSMLAEAIHSVVDIGNSVLVGYGLKQSDKPADAKHPFGYGSEIYFWSMIVAISIFGIGGGISLYEGIGHISHPTPIENAFVNYIVISLGIIIEGTSLFIAVRHFNKAKGTKGFYAFIVQSKDPSLFTVVFEDTAAVLGLLTALAGIFVSDIYGFWIADGIASCIIGMILMTVSFFLARESKGLLIGEGVEPYTLQQMRDLVQSTRGVEDIGVLRTLYLGPDQLLVNLDVKFISKMDAKEINECIDRIEAKLHKKYKEVKHVYIEVASQADIRRTRYEPAKV